MHPILCANEEDNCKNKEMPVDNENLGDVPSQHLGNYLLLWF